MAFHGHQHLSQEMALQHFSDQHAALLRSQSSSPAAGKQPLTAPTWLSSAILLRQQPYGGGGLHQWQSTGGGGDEINRRSESDGSGEERDYNGAAARCKADVLTHPLYEQLLSAHVQCLRIATPVDQLPRIDAQLAQSEHVVEKYGGVGRCNSHQALDDNKELDQFMVQ